VGGVEPVGDPRAPGDGAERHHRTLQIQLPQVELLAAGVVCLELIVPVVVGQGTRLLPDTGPDIALDLVGSRAFPKGVTIQVYRRPGARSMHLEHVR
jgi:hypothetical protein